MNETGFTAALSANAGISMTTPNARYWIDALHDEHEETFSDVTPELWEQMKTHPDFRDPDVIIFTHLHGDHFSRKMLEEAMRLYPTAKVILPSREEEVREFEVNGDRICCVRTMHEGKAFTDVLHETILIESCGRTFLFTGDMKVDPETAKGLIFEISPCTGSTYMGSSAGPDCLFAAFPWETTLHGRKIVEQIIKPAHTVLYHIPFKEDDRFGYRDAVRKALLRKENENIGSGKLSALMEPLEKIYL